MTGFLLAGVITTAAVYASFSDELNVVNHISMGDINISVSEYAKKGTGEVKYRESAKVLPGQVISKIPRIKNDALPCWIRARITYSGEKGELEGLTDENIGGISAEWVKRGEYYYYTKILKKQESVDLFQTVLIPETWSEEHSSQNLTLDIQTDAIQAANFKPDFSAMSPWGNQVIQQCIHEQNGALTCKKGETKLSVEFNGKAHRLIAVPNDFFVNLETAMPGDVLKDSVMISNTTDAEAEIFFCTDVKGRTEEQKRMLQNIGFEIRQNHKEIYKGSLDSKKLEKMYSLGKFKSGQKGSLEFQLEIPKEWDNTYALKKTDVTWIFAVKEKNETEHVSENNMNNDRDTGGAAQEKDVQSRRKNPVKTGDESKPVLLFLLLCGSGAIALSIRIYKGGKEL